ncbi:MAG: DUF2911 domain-containing protein [Acidobacteriota bacterium]
MNIQRKSLWAVGIMALALLTAPAAVAQLQGMPEASPDASVSQVIGVSKITIDYHRPAVRGRTIMGALVPNDQVWRAGANENTTITFSDPVKVEGESLAAGTYGLHMIPGEKDWTVIFSTNSTSWGSFSYDQEEDALRVTAQAEKASFEERVTFGFDSLDNDSGRVYVHWEETKVPFEVEFDTTALALAEIRNQLRSRAGFDWRGFVAAANFCLQNDTNLEEALQWADQAIARQENFNTLFVKGRLLQRMGDGEAEAMMAKALPLGNEQQVNFAGYQYLQAGQVERAIEIFQKNVDDHPESWNVYDSLGEAYGAKGDTQSSRRLYQKALEMAPENQKPRIEGILNSMS